MIQEDVYTALQATFSGRLYPMVAPMPVTLPYATYLLVSQVPENSLTGQPGLFNSRVQVDIFALSYSEAQSLKGSVRAAMAASLPNRAIEIVAQDLFEEDAKLHRVTMDWSVWHS